MKYLLKTLSVISCASLISGCATVFSGSTQSVYIKAIDRNTNAAVEGALCTVDDGTTIHTTNNNPGTVNVTRGRGQLIVNCKAKGYRQGDTTVGDSFNKTALINILWWPGFIVDGMTGAYKKYPSHFVISMIKTN